MLTTAASTCFLPSGHRCIGPCVLGLGFFPFGRVHPCVLPSGHGCTHASSPLATGAHIGRRAHAEIMRPRLHALVVKHMFKPCGHACMRRTLGTC
eukprot:365691-Chlamydomonas_euryale.AAC.2